MARQVMDMQNDNLGKLFEKTNSNFDELYEKSLKQDSSLADKAEKSKVDNIEARLDNLTANSGAATEGNAELIDLRVGADGKTYETAGKAIRAQISRLDENLAGLADSVSMESLKYQYVDNKLEFQDISEYQVDGITENLKIVKIITEDDSASIAIKSKNELKVSQVSSSGCDYDLSEDNCEIECTVPTSVAWAAIYTELILKDLVPNETYTLKFNITANRGERPAIYVYKSDLSNILASSTNLKTSQYPDRTDKLTFTPDSSTVVIRLYPIYNSSDYQNSETLKLSFNELMIYQGTSDYKYSHNIDISSRISDGYYSILISDGISITSTKCKVLIADYDDSGNDDEIILPSYQYIEKSVIFSDISTFDFGGTRDGDRIIKVSNAKSTARISIQSRNELEIKEKSASNCSYSTNDGIYKISTPTPVTSWPACYLELKLSNLTVGQQYTLKFNIITTRGERPRIYIYKLDMSETLATLTNVKTSQYQGADDRLTFTPNSTEVIVRIYPIVNVNDYPNTETIEMLLKDLMIYKGNDDYNYSRKVSISSKLSNGYYTIPTSDGLIVNHYDCNVLVSDNLIDNTIINKKKTIVCFGDSITGAFTDTDRDYPYILEQLLDAKVFNVGFGGCRMGPHPTTRYDNFCMYKLVDAIYTKDFSAQEADTTGSPTFPLRLSTLKSIDFSKVDIVTIAYGTNDWGGGYNTAKPTDNSENKFDTSNFYGAARYSIKKLLEINPKLKIIIVSPYYRYDASSGEDSDTLRPSTNPDYSLKNYVDALETVARDMKVPFINMYETMGVNAINREAYFDGTDGVHFNSAGMLILAQRLGAFINATYL